jgi:hypothetical protein
MATMATVSTSAAAATSSSSMRLLPSLDGLRGQAHSTFAPAPAQTTSSQMIPVFRADKKVQTRGTTQDVAHLGKTGFTTVIDRSVHHSHGQMSSRTVIRCSKAEGPLRRPSLNAPPAAPSTLPPPPSPPSPPPATPVVDVAPAPSVSASISKGSGVTIEYQRQRAKEMQDYFLDKKFEEQTSQSRIFGWTRKNEIANGRWVMFGLAVGLLTEFATGSDFVDQLKIIVSNLGIAEVD